MLITGTVPKTAFIQRKIIQLIHWSDWKDRNSTHITPSVFRTPAWISALKDFFISVSDVPSSSEVTIHQAQLISFIHALLKHVRRIPAKNKSSEIMTAPETPQSTIQHNNSLFFTYKTLKEVLFVRELCICLVHENKTNHRETSC